jgi:hypothetical protein
MSHFAEIDDDNRVVQVIVAEQEFIDTLPGRWLQTSYNTRGGVHYGPDGLPDGGVPLRGNYARIGMLYDPLLDEFADPAPYPSWIRDSHGYWQPPTPAPAEAFTSTTSTYYCWDEAVLSWVEHPLQLPDGPPQSVSTAT